MSISQEIIKTALLGTDKLVPSMPEELSALSGILKSEDKEANFLHLAHSYFLYAEAGQESVILDIEMTPCFTEQKTVISSSNTKLLKSLIHSNEEVLFQYMICKCIQHKQVATPELLPDLLIMANEDKKMAEKLLTVCGETGQWLCSLNEEWKHFTIQDLNDEEWETGNFQSRKKHLEEIRVTQPEEMIVQIQKIFNQENATNRLALLELLSVQLSTNDIDFLLSLEKDKSQKVREYSSRLLAQIEGSEKNQQFTQALQQIMVIKEERHLLISKKKKLSINMNAILPDSIFSFGIEKISEQKGAIDQYYWAAQLISVIHPSQIASIYQCTETELIELFLKDNELKKFVHLLEEAVLRFRHQRWASELIKNKDNPSIELLDCIPFNQQASFYSFYHDTNTVALMNYLMDDSYTEINEDLALTFINYLEKEPYVNSSQLYQKLALHLPPSIISVLRKKLDIGKDDYQYKYYKQQVSEMLRIIEIKQTIKF